MTNNHHRHFVCAKVDSVRQYIELTKRDYPGFLNDEGLNNYITRVCPQFLLSLGSVMSKKSKVTCKTFDKFLTITRSLRNTSYLSNMELTIDNGGYQIQKGFLDAADIPGFIYRFYDLLDTPGLPIDWTFTLDIAPGKVNVFQNESQLISLNDLSYSRAAQLPDTVRNKTIYIEHFRNLELIRVWEKLHQQDYHNSFNHFGTGGLASFARGRSQPCVDYAIPLVRALKDAKDRGITSFRYHVLGASQFTYFLIHSLFEHHIKMIHGIDVEITCDSTIIFSKFFRTYSLPVIDSDNQRLHEIVLHSDKLNNPTPSGETNLSEFVLSTENILVPYGFQPLEERYDTIYQPGKKRDQFTRLAYTYGMLLYLHNFYIVEQWCRDAVDDLYLLFLTKKEKEFCAATTDMLVRICGMPDTPYRHKNHQYMAKRIWNSLDMLTKLNWEYSVHVVDCFLTKKKAA